MRRCNPSNEWGESTGIMIDATEDLFEVYDRMPVIVYSDEHDACINAPTVDAIAPPRKYPASRLAVDWTCDP